MLYLPERELQMHKGKDKSGQSRGLGKAGGLGRRGSLDTSKQAPGARTAP